MQFYPSFEEAAALGRQDYDFIPICGDMPADLMTPVSLFLSLRDKVDTAFLLESAENGEQVGRYSFVSWDPRGQYTAFGNQVTVVDGTTATVLECDNPLEDLAARMQAHRSPRLPGQPKLTGGFVGYFGYDTLRYVEPTLKNIPTDTLKLPDIHLMLCDKIVAFDHLKHKMTIIVNMPVKGDVEANYKEATAQIQELCHTIRGLQPVLPASRANGKQCVVTSNITKEQYMDNVRRAKAYIQAGDIFQVVPSRRLEVENPPDAFSVYRMLRMTNPSPYMYYFKFPEYEISGASPEMLVSVENGRVATRPIAGTIRRGADEAEDLKLENQLLADTKEQAEHTMLVDLGRNDVGKVSEIGTVEVRRFMAVERYSQLMHLVSDVQGVLRSDRSSMDALAAVMPAGTLSGAPKLRAMEIIDELEPCKRGLYGGAIGYLGFDGNMDTCIAIRTVLFTGGKAYVQSGGGVVADSDPEKEYMEAETKAKAMVKAIMEADTL